MAEPYRRHWVVVGGLVLYWAELSQTEKAVAGGGLRAKQNFQV